MGSPPKNKGERKIERGSIAIILRYADCVDVLLMLMGAVGAVGDGMSTNILLIFASRIMNSLGYGNQQQQQQSSGTANNYMSQVEKCSLYFVYLGLAVMLLAFMEGYCWSKTSERQVLRIRYKYLEAVLRQEVGFFESQEATTSEIINSISKDTSLLQEVLSEKVQLHFNTLFFIKSTKYTQKN
ncbi:putative ABC transporter B family member 8 [Arachis duranensis]|uniref:ABC transporter B family member 8 n=1 Tax=Arachis duranensis TaxID=130453 RepID=A0A9C6TZC2_ARADU|nr:putative ABC transporter B family member 8 [Arachis duranensis]